MNQHLETILKLIHQSERLSAMEMSVITKSLQDANNEWEEKDRVLAMEASLDRVRSKAIAMQKSDDLSLAVAIIFEEL